jgi:predicted HTH domain antitoxin
MTSMVASSSSNEGKVHEVHVSEELREAGGWSAEELESEVRFLLAARLFAERKVSLGRATKLSGMAMTDFITRVSDLGIPVIDLDEDELREEFRED